jgi:hypothetical protein
MMIRQNGVTLKGFSSLSSALIRVLKNPLGTLSKRRSFPRKRESSPSTSDFGRLAEWIPAFAGMTVTSGVP